VIVGVALAFGGVALVIVLRDSLTRNVQTAAELRAQDVASVLKSGTAPSTLAIGNEEDAVLQVVNPSGVVVSSSPNIAGKAPIAKLRPGQRATVRRSPVGGVGSFRIVAVRADAPNGTLTVLSGRSLDPVTDSVELVSRVLASGLPVLLVLVCATSWALVGQALRPVEGIRAEVSRISERALERRVPEPVGDDEIARLARTMNEMLARLEASQARQRQFVSDASHELRSPIATIRYHTEVMRAHPDPSRLDAFTADVLAEDMRLERLVSDLVTLARSDEHTLRLATRTVDLDDIVFEEATRVRHTTSLAVDTSRVNAGPVSGDQAQLRQVIRNLIDNAARHALSGVTIAMVATKHEIVLSVDDDGPGVAPADRSRIFDRFTRLDDGRARDAGGSGLGLAIVREIVAAHGGTVRVEDAPSGGARFEVHLPASAI
jgi:signal transduction histidine kinase